MSNSSVEVDELEEVMAYAHHTLYCGPHTPHHSPEHVGPSPLPLLEHQLAVRHPHDDHKRHTTKHHSAHDLPVGQRCVDEEYAAEEDGERMPHGKRDP